MECPQALHFTVDTSGGILLGSREYFRLQYRHVTLHVFAAGDNFLGGSDLSGIL
jgi:hypothetical protein